MLLFTETFYKIQKAIDDGYRIIILRGGTGASKTISFMQYLCIMASKHKKKIDIVAETIPALKKGVLSDMINAGIADSLNLPWYDMLNKQDLSASFQTGSTMNFMSFENELQARGPRRSILYINEANRIAWGIVDQLLMRTSELVFVDFNPTGKFWVCDKILENPKYKNEAIEIVVTYKDNQYLSKKIVEYIESHKDNEAWWRVYGLGEWGKLEGLILTNWETREFDKESFENYRHGIDWGFSTDPFVYIRSSINRQKREIYICDEIYEIGLFNFDAANRVRGMIKGDIVTCDSAEPKSISEFINYNIHAKGAKKGQGSIESGLKFLQEYKIIVHPSCTSFLREISTYSYRENKNDGGYYNVPEDKNNHGIDALRYATEDDIVGDTFKF